MIQNQETAPSRWLKQHELSLVAYPISVKALCIGTLNVGRIRGKAIELVEATSQRKVDLCLFQETKWKMGVFLEN